MSNLILSCCEHPTLMAFTAKLRCGPCKAIEPTLQKFMLEDKLTGIPKSGFHIRQFDESEQIGKNALSAFKITHLPTLLVYVPESEDGKRYNLYQLQTDRSYEGIRESVQHIMQNPHQTKHKRWSNVPSLAMSCKPVEDVPIPKHRALFN